MISLNKITMKTYFKNYKEVVNSECVSICNHYKEIAHKAKTSLRKNLKVNKITCVNKIIKT